MATIKVKYLKSAAGVEEGTIKTLPNTLRSIINSLVEQQIVEIIDGEGILEKPKATKVQKPKAK